MALASWLRVLPGLTPHGLRHGHQTWMDEDCIAEVLKSERMGYEVPGMRAVYGHVTTGVRDELSAALEQRWTASLQERAALSPASSVQAIDDLLRDLNPGLLPNWFQKTDTPAAPFIGAPNRRYRLVVGTQVELSASLYPQRSCEELGGMFLARLDGKRPLSGGCQALTAGFSGITVSMTSMTWREPCE